MADLVDILREMRAHKKETYRFKDLVHRFDLDPPAEQRLREQLDQLVRTGAVRHGRGGRYRWAGRGLVDGIVHLRRDGQASLRRHDRPDESLGTLSSRHLNGAIHGDTVLAGLEKKGPRRTLRVELILQRPSSRVIGTIATRGAQTYLQPEDDRLPLLRVTNAALAQGHQGDLAAVEIEAGTIGADLRGEMVECFGPPASLATEIKRIAFKFSLPHDFPAETRQIAAQVQEQGFVWDPICTDLRSLPLVTIDGAAAKDFDDAVAAQTEAGGIRLWVCIADVSHYVTPGDALDQEAYRRGTSVYFPGSCLPMLPEEISNDLCSLIPGAERRVLCAELLFDANGERLESHFYPAIMRSHARWIYERVAALMDHPQTATDEEKPLLASLKAMSQLASVLQKNRFDRGSLDFDLPEPEIVLDLRGRPDEIAVAQRTDAHRLIEELMLAANEAVALFLRQHEMPFLSRVHDAPALDKLHDFQQLIARFNLGINLGHPEGLHAAFAELLANLKGHPLESLLNRQLLRTLAQACYSPEARGHFGLAASDYCHFTSPIRRYPDLLVHRAVKQVLRHQNKKGRNDLVEVGAHCSVLERRAMEAEREIRQQKKCQYMEQRVGQSFTGRISSVARFGFFVELDGIPVEGLVPMTSLSDDYYQFDPLTLSLTGEKRRRRFQLGDKVAIIVAHVDLFRNEIDLTLQQMTAPPTSHTRKRAGRRRRRRS